MNNSQLYLGTYGSRDLADTKLCSSICETFTYEDYQMIWNKTGEGIKLNATEDQCTNCQGKPAYEQNPNNRGYSSTTKDIIAYSVIGGCCLFCIAGCCFFKNIDKLTKKVDEVNEPETIHKHTEVKTVTVIEKEIEVPVLVPPPQ